jgi:Lrp/AsnC family leucine-responsive transcriptional regulator
MPVRHSDLDSFDLRLLELMQADARRPVPELAELVGLSSPACYRRIRRLREIGAMLSEVAVVQPKTLGWGVSMFVLVVLEREGSRTVADLLGKFSEHPQVIECANVTGEYDIAVRLVARDMEDYDDVAQTLFVDDDRVRSFKTLVVIREGQSSRALSAAE